MLFFKSKKKNKKYKNHANQRSLSGISIKVDWMVILFVFLILLLAASWYSYKKFDLVTKGEAGKTVEVIEDVSDQIDVEALQNVIKMFEEKEARFRNL